MPVQPPLAWLPEQARGAVTIFSSREPALRAVGSARAGSGHTMAPFLPRRGVMPEQGA